MNKPIVILLVDAPNSINLDIVSVMTAVKLEGELKLVKAFADWSNWRYLDTLAWELFKHDVELIHVPSVFFNGNKPKLLCDEALMVWLLRFLEKGNEYWPVSRAIEKICLVAGDAHYIPVVLACQRRGKEVVVIFSEDASGKLRGVADKFVAVPPRSKVSEDLSRITVQAEESTQNFDCAFIGGNKE